MLRTKACLEALLLFLPVILTGYCHGRRQDTSSSCQEVPGREVLYPTSFVELYTLIHIVCIVCCLRIWQGHLFSCHLTCFPSSLRKEFLQCLQLFPARPYIGRYSHGIGEQYVLLFNVGKVVIQVLIETAGSTIRNEPQCGVGS